MLVSRRRCWGGVGSAGGVEEVQEVLGDGLWCCGIGGSNAGGSAGGAWGRRKCLGSAISAGGAGGVKEVVRSGRRCWVPRCLFKLSI